MMRWTTGGLIAVVFLLSTVCSAPLPSADDEDDPLRLPRNSIPIRYDIFLNTNVHTGNRAFDGVVTIDIVITEETDTITLHNRGLVPLSTRLYDNGFDDVPHNISSDTSRDFFFITSIGRMLQAGEFLSVEITYSGQLAHEMNGFYLSSYRIQGDIRYLAATQFQATAARAAFFSYDEPEYKAEFKLAIKHATAYAAISSTIGTTVDHGDETSTTTFATSPIMSSYLLAFVVSDFDYSSNELDLPVGETAQRVYARPDEKARTEFALDHSIKFLKQLELWARYSYELPKMFSAAIPDFAAGAMENWGLITYKEQYLIVDERSHQRERFESMRVIAHELGHQFFGNVITCRWWNYIWLNEGFATFLEYLLIELEYPELRMRDWFNVHRIHAAFRPDSLESSHPMTYDGQTQGSIVYDKAGCIIRMFQYSLGHELFRVAMSVYLENNHHKPVTSDDLYAAVEEVIAESSFTEFNFTNAFKTWENQKGYPFLHVTADDSSSSIRISQKRYLALADKSNGTDDSLWYIPINFAVQYRPDFEDLTITNYLLDDQRETTIPYPAAFTSTQWFIFNKQQIGYYRVMYDENNWQQLIRILNNNFEDIHILNRAQLVDDALNFAADEYLDFAYAFGVLSYLERETDYIPWRAAITNLDKLDYIMAGQPVHANFQRYVRKLVRLMYVTYGLEEREGDTMMDQYARELAIDWTCRMGDERCLRDTYSYTRRIALEGLVVPKSLEITYICNGLRGLGKQEEFTAIWNRLLNSDDQSERLRLIDGLVCSSDPTALRNLLRATIEPDAELSYKDQEISRIWGNIHSRSSIGIDVMIDMIDEFYDEIRTMSSTQVASTINSISQRISRDSDRMKLNVLMDRLVARPTDPLNADTRTNALNNMQVTINWVASEKFTQATYYVNRYIETIENEENRLVLPKWSEPRHYKIHITATGIPFGVRDFSGEIEIDALVKETTDRIIIHSREQTILDVQVFNKNDMTEITVLDYSTYAGAHTLTIYLLNEILANSDILVRIKYSGLMQTTEVNVGFSISSYVHEGVTRYLGVTQFESSLGGRFAFPHYDEPRYKTTFELTLTHSDRHHAISNTFGTAVENGNGTVTTTFEQTPIMSSYLLAFVISDLQNVTNEQTKQENETLQRIWVRPDSLSKAWYALESSDRALKALEDYLDFKYALPKMDSASIPFKTGAMENWGMITYRENAMIYEENYEDIPHDIKFSGVSVIVHEEAHQFFGNLATFEWWDYLWLSEGFARLFGYQITGVLYPEWRTRHFFNIRSLHSAFRYDSGDSTRAMTPTPSLLTPTEIRLSFDTIAYDKAGSVIGMFQNTVGENIFRAALNLYLTNNDYKSVIAQNLYDAFQTVMDRNSFTDINFAAAFSTWELQKGYPVIYCTYSDSTRQFQITQERYFTQKQEMSNDTSNWFIPLNFATESDPTFDDTSITNYFNNGLPSMTIPVPTSFDTNQWFIFNKQQIGYYRVNYDAANWHAITLALNSANYDNIHVLNRVQLIDDAVNFAAGGYINYDILFGLLQYLSRETEYTPWYSADRFISQLYTAFGPFNSDLNSFVRHLSKRFYDHFKLEVNGVIPFEELYERYGRETAIRIACNAGNEDCIEDLLNVLQQFIEVERPIPKGLESVIWCNSLKGANEFQWREMWSRMQMASDATFRSQILSSLGCSGNSTLLIEYLVSTVGTDINYTQAERRNVLSAVLNSNVGLQAVITFMGAYQAQIMTSYGYTLEALLSVPARTVKSRAQQTLFNNYLTTVTDLTDPIATNIDTLIQNNFLVQQQSFYPEVMRMVQAASENQWRLPKTSEPRHYRLHLDTRNIPSGDRAFTGEIEIQVEITEPTDRIMMHSKEQVIDEVRVFRGDGTTEVELLEYHLFPETDTLTIYFANYVLTNDELIVHIKYSTELLLAAYGFYQTSYFINGEQRFLGATQFEPTRGRYAFPHYDEPRFKAVFDFSITHDISHTAIANTFGTRVENGDGTATTTFEPSPLMSSYLLAFVISDLQSVNNTATMLPGETLHRVWVRPDSLTKAWYAVEVSAKVLQALEDYVGFDYELPKVDSAGVPNKGGAMENWGMITYRENAMIYEENYEDISHRQKWSGVDVIAHELAHQFFGDTVTCEWWDTLWLNEGFATLFEYHLSGILYPEWRVRDLFNLITLQDVFRDDASDITTAMTKPLSTPVEISDAFDYVVYDKAGSVLRMFQNAVGEDIFKAALNLYLGTNHFAKITKHSTLNSLPGPSICNSSLDKDKLLKIKNDGCRLTDTENFALVTFEVLPKTYRMINHKAINSQPLVDAFNSEMTSQNFTDFDFDIAFRTWELQKGYPVIHVSYSDSRQFVITQQRFFTLRNQSAGDTSSWYIPLNFATESDPNFDDTRITEYFVNEQEQHLINVPSQFQPSQWFVFNKQQLGYYRVNYDPQNWNAITDALHSDDYNQIHVLNRAQLIDDALSFAEGDYLGYEVLLNILPYLRRENDYTPWYSVDRFITSLYNAFGPQNNNLNQFVRILSENFYDTFKVPDDGYIPFEELFQRFSRELALKLACNAGNERCLSDTFNVNRRFIEDDHPVPKGLENVVLCSGLRGTAKETQWNELYRIMQTITDATLKSQVRNALGCTDDQNLLKNYLESTLDEGSYTQTERQNVLSAVLNSRSGLSAVVAFIGDNEFEILRLFGYNTLEDLLNIPARLIKTANEQTIFLDFIQTLSQLEGTNSSRITAIIDNNFQVQQQVHFQQSMQFIRQYLNDGQETTTEEQTEQTTSPTEDTTVSTEPPTNETSEPTDVTEPTPPAGAASLSLQLATLFTSLLIVFTFKI